MKTLGILMEFISTVRTSGEGGGISPGGSARQATAWIKLITYRFKPANNSR